jgi:hypothetical protein
MRTILNAFHQWLVEACFLHSVYALHRRFAARAIPVSVAQNLR